MIRAFEPSDMNEVLAIWLHASIGAHNFVDREFWESRVDEMRDKYIPASETWVFISSNTPCGFVSLYEDMLAALFVAPEFQGKGIGQQLMEKAKSERKNLHLSVYSENLRGVRFYKKCGFIPVEERIDEHTGHSEILMEYLPEEVRP